MWYTCSIIHEVEDVDAFSLHAVSIKVEVEQAFGNCYWILNCGKHSSNGNSLMNASHLWRLVCWCEYSRMLGKAFQRWRHEASRFEWQTMLWKEGLWLQVLSCINIALKNWSTEIVMLNKKKLLLTQEFLKKDWDTLLDFIKFVPDGCHILSGKMKAQRVGISQELLEHLWCGHWGLNPEPLDYDPMP